MLLAVILLAVSAAACTPKIDYYLDVDEEGVRANGPAYPNGSWQMELAGMETEMQPGQELHWRLSYDLEGENLLAYKSQIEDIAVVAAARRMADQDGHYRDQDSYFYSTYLTPSGLPVEGFQYLIANSHIGGPYKTPLDLFHQVPLETVEITDSQIRFSAAINDKLKDDFPAGLYRIELAVFAYVQDHWLPLHMLRAVDGFVFSCDINYESLYFTKVFLPPIRVGAIKPPRVIWTLFTSMSNHGVAGVVAAEDAGHFGISNRVKLASRYLLPCTPDRGECVFRLEPELPTVNRHKFFMAKNYPYDMFEPDCSRGQLTVAVKKPDGEVDRLGKHDFEECGFAGPTTGSNDLNYRFDQFGRYEITMSGEMFDRFGNIYEGGGTYEVWVAYPLTFATGLKPGNHRKVGQFYSPAATINPPVPAQVEASVKFYPATHPQDVITAEYHGRAQRYGYYFPDASQPMLRFPEPGEYLFEIMATYRDSRGRVFMGNMKNAAAVLPAEANMTLHGSPEWGYRRTKELSFELDGDVGRNQGTTHFPYRSGDMIYYAGNALMGQAIQPMVSVSEKTGHIQQIMNTRFFPKLVRLRKQPLRIEQQHFFPGCQDQLRYYVNSDQPRELLPLMSTTSKGYSPFEYPELVDRRAYFYMASSRPGFSVYFVIGDSTIAENYWNNGMYDYDHTVGAAKIGDQPGDVTWSIVSGIFADYPAEKSFTGIYSSGGVALLLGDNSIYESAPFARPVDTINGVDVYIYAGVGPSPGTLYETGAVKGVGSITVPMAPHEVLIDIHKPDSEVHHCRGRADEIGNFLCPEGAIVFDQPGVYRVFAKYWEGERTGVCPGARGGWYQVYAAEKDSAHQVLFDDSMRRQVPYEDTFIVSGRVEPAIKHGQGYYSVVAPGILMDEGTMEVRDSKFRFSIYPNQFGAQFANLFDLLRLNLLDFRLVYLSRSYRDSQKGTDLLRFLEVILHGYQHPFLSDTVEVTAFVEGEDESGRPVTAGGKFVLRGSRVVLIQDLLAGNAGDED